MNGVETEIPSIVPGLSTEQLNSLLSTERPSRDIIRTAIDHARKRQSQGKSVWAN